MKKLIIIGTILLVAIFLFFKLFPPGPKGYQIIPNKFEKELVWGKNYKKWAKEDGKNLEFEIKQKLTDEELILNYAKQKNIIVTDKELMSRYKEVYSKSGGEEKYLKLIKERYGIGKEDYLNKLAIDLLKIKVQEQLKKPIIDWLLEQRGK